MPTKDPTPSPGAPKGAQPEPIVVQPVVQLKLPDPVRGFEVCEGKTPD